jgi:hypothetical protein
MNKTYKHHIVISVTGSNYSGKSGISRFIQDALQSRGITAELVESIPGDASKNPEHVDAAMSHIANPEHPVDVVIVDVSGRPSPITEFKRLVYTLDAQLAANHGKQFTTATDEARIAMRRTYLRDKCQRYGIPWPVALLLAPQLDDRRTLRDVVE